MIDSASPMTQPQQRRAQIRGLTFALLAYFTSWWMLRHAAPWLGQNGTVPQWPTFFDLLLTVPAMTWWLHRRDRKLAWRRALKLAGVGLFVAVLIVPGESNPALQLLNGLRKFIEAAFVIVELWAMVGIVGFLRSLKADENLDDAMRTRVRPTCGDNFAAGALAFELRMWLHVFASRKRVWNYVGDEHFSYHRKDGNASNQQGFLLILLIDLVPMHLLLSLFANSVVAWTISLLTLYSAAMFYAHYLASWRCPISLDEKYLYLRYGMQVDEVAIPFSAIASVERSQGRICRAKEWVRLNDAGNPNVCVRFKQDISIPGYYGFRSLVRSVYIGLDQAPKFIVELDRRIAKDVKP
jgi:hypothetical protein